MAWSSFIPFVQESMNPKSFTRFVRCVFIGLYVLIFCNSIEVMSCALVICGPSGVGKGSMIASFCRKFPNTTALTVSHTTRKPRPGNKYFLLMFFYHFSSLSSSWPPPRCMIVCLFIAYTERWNQWIPLSLRNRNRNARGYFKRQIPWAC